MSDKKNTEESVKRSIADWSLALPASALALLAGLMLTVANDTAIALQLAGQHGETILLMRQEIDILRLETKDRYTNKDAERDLGYIREDITELNQVIREAHRVSP